MKKIRDALYCQMQILLGPICFLRRDGKREEEGPSPPSFNVCFLEEEKLEEKWGFFLKSKLG